MNAYLPPERLDELQAALKDRMALLREEVRAALERSGNENFETIAGQVSDFKDAAFASAVLNLNFADAERDAAEIREIDAALARIADGSYGLCLDCGEAIDPDRLQAYPAARRCRACQELSERRQKRR